jgi:GntR family galactonate operon transcriptional repressor
MEPIVSAPKSIHQHVVDGLGRRICGGEFQPGSFLPPEAALCEQLQVSRVVVREAVKVLGAKGILEVRSKLGTRVLPVESWNTLDHQVMEWFMGGANRSKNLRDLMEFRRIIEPNATRLAVDRITEAQLETMSEAYAGMEAAVEAGDADAYVKADLQFHTTILIAAGNIYLMNMRDAITNMMHQSFSISRRVAGAERLSLPLHYDLLMGLKRRDPVGAGNAIDRLIARAEQNLEQWLLSAERDSGEDGAAAVPLRLPGDERP